MNTVKEIAKDAIKHIEEDLIKKILLTPRNRLFLFHHSLGRKIRNEYNFWSDKEILKDIGVDHPDDASSLIIEEIHTILVQDRGDQDKNLLNDEQLFKEWKKERGLK